MKNGQFKMTVKSMNVHSIQVAITCKKRIMDINYRNQFVIQYITYMNNIWGALSRTLSSLSTHEQLVLDYNS
jgi:hypothetical protein